jgi:hypothetical protein
MLAPERIRPSTATAAAKDPRRRDQLRAILAVVIVLVLVIAGVFLGLQKLLGSRSSAVPVALESVSSAGPNPFMPPAGVDLAVAAVADAATTASGSSSGLYGAARNASSCDSRALVAYLVANEVKASAWAVILKIEVPAIPAYVAGLTPALLRTDTYVTNPGFRIAKASATISVLQAGTAVLIDKFGTPRVKCFSGNPLTEATTLSGPKFIGTPWSGFDEAKITVIQPNDTPVGAFTMVNPINGEVIERPAGTSGASDRVITPGRPDPPVAAPPRPNPRPVPPIKNTPPQAEVAPAEPPPPVPTDDPVPPDQ